MLPELVIIIVLIVANAFFAGAEIAIVALRKTRLEQMADEGRPGARAVLALRADPERFLATVQIGITVVGATAAAFGGASIATRLEPHLQRVSWLALHAESVALGLVVVVVSYLSIVVGELVPKSLALRGAETYSLVVARPLLFIAWLARPLVWLLTASSNLLLRPFGDRTTFTEARHSAEELQQLVDEATRSGSVHPRVGEIASRALDFGELTAADVMVPRQQVVMLPRHAPPDEVRRVLLEHTHTRMPVYDGTVDNIVGYVSVKDVLSLAWEGRLIVLEDLLRPAFFVPESQRAVELLQVMRERRFPLAIVVDEQGGMSGIITFEDLVEEVVGEIFSEHAEVLPAAFTRNPDGSIDLDGLLPVREANRQLQLGLPEDGQWSTVAGLCLAVAGRIPASGERLELEGGVVLEIIDGTSRSVRKIRVHASNRGRRNRPGTDGTQGSLE